MGEIYSRCVLKIKRPRVGLLSIGEEEHKGNALTRDATPLLKVDRLSISSATWRAAIFFPAQRDVIVCDGFVGNVALKVSEGLSEMIRRMLRESLEATVTRKIGYALSRSAYRDFKKRVDYAEYGGAPLLGVKGVCIICHGRSDSNAIKNAIRVAADFASSNMNQRIEEELREYAKRVNVMRRLLLVFCRCCAAAQRISRRAEKFNHVQWTMTFDQASAAPGATVLGRSRSHRRSRVAHVLADHAARADSDHNSGPITAPPSRSSRFFEPPPIRKFDPNFNADTETYEGSQAFPRPHRTEEGPAARPRHDHFRAALPDLQRHILHSAANPYGQRGVEYRGVGAPPRRSPSPPVTSKRSRTAQKRSGPTSSAAATGDRRPRGFPRSGFRIRPRRHLHPLRLPDDPDHDVVFRRTARRTAPGDHLLPRHHRSVQRSRV